MQLKKALAAVLSGLILFSSTGCSVVTTNIETVVSPPKISSEQAAIYKAFLDSGQLGKSIDLKYPQSGENRSAIVTANIDDEETEEALVFYEGKTQSSVSGGGIGICLLDQVDGKWVKVWDVAGAGTDVDKVVFFRDSASGRKFVIVGFSMENQQQKTYKVYTYENGTFSSIYEDSYQVLEVYDIDEDFQDEIITVDTETTESENINTSGAGIVPVKTTANLIEYQGTEFVKTDQIALLGQAVEYNNILKDESNATFGKPALFLDEVLSRKGSTVMYATEVLVCEEGKLKNLTDDPERKLYEQTYRTQASACDDIDRNDVIEIPNTKLFPGYSETDEHPLYMTEWYRLTEDGMELQYTSYINYSQGFSFTLPASWVGNVTAKNVVENDETEFFVYDESLENDQQKIMSLKVENISDIDIRSEGIPAGYFEITRVGQLAFLAKNHKGGGEYQISDNDILGNFVDLYILGD